MGDMITLRRPRRPLVVEWHVVAIAVVFLLLFVAPGGDRSGDRPPAAEGPRDASVVFSIVANFVILGAVIPLLAVTGRNRLSDYGIDMQGWRAEVRFGGLGYLVAMPLVVAVLLAMSPCAARRPSILF